MNKEFHINRYPPTTDKSLRSWSAADELLVANIRKKPSSATSCAIMNDRFGYLALHLSFLSSTIFTHHKSQEDAIKYNFEKNGLSYPNFVHFVNEPLPKKSHDVVVIKIPKSMDLFHLFLRSAHALSNENTVVYCGFMTRHFTSTILDTAALYFDNQRQSLAKKKARLLILSKPKTIEKKLPPINTILYEKAYPNKRYYQQYYGVFSAHHIDYATQFLLDHLTIEPHVQTILDLASGNGVIAAEIRSKHPEVELHLLDDSHLAIESSKLNLIEGENHFHYDYNLKGLPSNSFDMVVSNPPFHFEHENTIEIALGLFRDVHRVLKPGGRFVLVANRHLNYQTHLTSLFDRVLQIKQNQKFEIIGCTK